MSKIFITSDLHLEHQKDFLYAPRGYNNIDEHDDDIIRKWNEVVNEDDIIYFLGDIALCGGDDARKADAANKINKLNGNIKWIRGNHDGDGIVSYVLSKCENVEYLGWSTMIKYRKYHFYLSHYPALTANYDEDKPLKAKVISICGHSHIQDCFADWKEGIIFHCELDTNDCYPWLLDDIIEKCKEKHNENRD